MAKTDNQKLTLEEYKKKYSKPQNAKVAKSFVIIFELTIGIILFYFLVSLVGKSFEIHEYVGYVAIFIALLIFVFGYLIPLIRIKKNLPFETSIRNKDLQVVKKYNAKLRKNISKNIIDVTNKTDDIGWYSKEKVGNLAIALQSGSNEDLRKNLTDIMKTDVNVASNKMIREHSLNVGLTTAISQSNALDTAFIILYELDLIKDLVYLYGFRPSDAKLMKIYEAVIASALVSYGLGNASANIAGGVVKKISDVTSSIPILGEAIGIAIDSTIQGVINASLTVIIGFQTKKYLKQEYHLQDILDDIIVDDATEKENEQELLAEVKTVVGKNSKRKNNKGTK